MPSASDFYNELKGANTRLDGVNGKLDEVKGKLDDVKSKLDALKSATDAVKASVDNANKTLNWGFGGLITLGNYTNQALHHNALQNDTIICILEHISRNTCMLLNEAHQQTGLQTTINESTTALAELYAATHAEAALTREREAALRKQIEACCPPKPEPAVCSHERCPSPGDLREPERVNPRPDR
jgi:hypothetical protein